MEAEIPGLAGLFRDRLNSLKFGIVVWAIQAASMVFWLVNYYWERAAFAEVDPGFIMERRPETFLFNVVGSAVNIAALYYVYWKTSRTFDDYQLRLKIAKVSPNLFKSYSMANPLIDRVRDLLGEIGQVAYLVVSVNSLFYAFGFSVLLWGEFMNPWLFWHPTGIDPAVLDMLMGYWIRRMVFYGVNAGLLWTLGLWSARSGLRVFGMHLVLERSHEEQMRGLATKYPSPLT